jgi:hypothetical protein
MQGFSPRQARRDAVLHVARADPRETLARAQLAQVAHLLAREAGHLGAVVKPRLLQQREARVRRVLEPRQDGPQGRHLERVRRDRAARHAPARELAPVDLDLVLHGQVVGHVDLDRAVAERLHQVVARELLVLGLVRVAEDDLVDRRLRELARLDRVLLRRAEQVVEERDVELEHFDELEQAAVRDVELAVEVERARVAVRPVLGDLAVVQVAGQLRSSPGSSRPWAGTCRCRSGPSPTAPCAGHARAR